MLSKARLVLPVAAAAAIAISACGAASAATKTYNYKRSTAAVAAHHDVSFAKSSGAALKLAKVAIADGGSTLHKQILVDSAGHAVYLLSGDSTKHPQCTSSGCLSTWPAVTTTAKHPKLGKGVSGKLTVWKHAGIDQLVLNGHPLYGFVGDSAGAANGNGIKSFGGTWSVLSAKGSAAKFSSTRSSGSGGGSGW